MRTLTDPLLQQLRDIHLPPPITVWPLAPGWYGLILIFIAIALYFAYRWWQLKQGQNYRKAALRKLQQLRTAPESASQIAALSELLKRVALTAYPEQSVAGLQGEAWLQFLDQTGQTKDFSVGVGRLLAQGPYQRQLTTPSPEFFALLEYWIKHHHV